MNIEKAKIINSAADFSKCKGYDRIYFGDEFCQLKIPQIKDLKRIASKSAGVKISLVLPYLTAEYFDTAKKLADFAAENPSVFDEVVFNDWGFFYFIRENHPGLKLVLGRLLTKQKTDPFANEIIKNKQKITASLHNIFVPKKISGETVEYFGETFINSKIFQKFMLQNNIARVEIDNVNWNMNIKLPCNIKASIYYPYVKISTTRFCGYLNMLGENCSKQCAKFSIELKKYRSQYKYIINGNAVMFRNDKLPEIKLMRDNCIDRIVFNE